MNELRGSLDTIEQGMKALKRRVLMAALRPGIDVEAAAGSRLGYPEADPDVRALYAWHDGTNLEGVLLDDIYLLPGFFMLSWSEANNHYSDLAGTWRWKQEWFPLFANDAGDYYLIDYASTSRGVIRYSCFDDAEASLEFASLPIMLATIAAAYKHRVFFLGPDGYLEVDGPGFTALSSTPDDDGTH